MTISVSTDITSAPPRNTVTVAVPGGSIMSAVSVWRNDASGQSLLRTQPTPGFTSQFVFDYECPYGVPVTYGWTTTYTPPTGTVLWDETWASIAAWSLAGPAATVSGGKIQSPSLSSSASAAATRATTTGAYRVTIASMANAGAAGASLSVGLDKTAGTPGSILTLTLTTGVGLSILWANSTSSGVIPIDPSQPITIDMGTNSVTVSGTGGSYSYAIAAPTLGQVSVIFKGTSGTMTAGAQTVGEIKVQAYGTTTALSETSAPVTLSPADLWLVHPTVPNLSVKVKQFDTSTVTLTSIDAITNAANATTHQILGATKPIITTTGVRGSDTGSLGIRTYTSAAEIALAALLLDQTPVLINFPVSWNTNFAVGFYQVGDVARAKAVETGNHPYRDFTLPIVAVQAPVASVQNTGWSYAALLLGYASCSSVKARFATYANLLANV